MTCCFCAKALKYNYNLSIEYRSGLPADIFISEYVAANGLDGRECVRCQATVYAESQYTTPAAYERSTPAGAACKRLIMFFISTTK